MLFFLEGGLTRDVYLCLVTRLKPTPSHLGSSPAIFRVLPRCGHVQLGSQLIIACSGCPVPVSLALNHLHQSATVSAPLPSLSACSVAVNILCLVLDPPNPLSSLCYPALGLGRLTHSRDFITGSHFCTLPLKLSSVTQLSVPTISSWALSRDTLLCYPPSLVILNIRTALEKINPVVISLPFSLFLLCLVGSSPNTSHSEYLK